MNVLEKKAEIEAMQAELQAEMDRIKEEAERAERIERAKTSAKNQLANAVNRVKTKNHWVKRFAIEAKNVNVVVKKGPAELRKQVYGAVIVRQKYAIRRLNGIRVCFEDNAAVLITPEGETKGTDIKGPVAAEASEKWPRVANLASTVV